MILSPVHGAIDARGCSVRFLNKLYPWLLPIIVTVVLVLSIVAGEKLKRNTPEGKFNRIQLGMDRERVYEILGPTWTTIREYYRVVWYFDDFNVVIQFDEWNQVSTKSLERHYRLHDHNSDK